MKHAGPDALDGIEPLLGQLRALGVLKERTRGIFYHNGRSFLHFHEDPAGLFADLRFHGADVRLRVSEPAERDALLAKVRGALEG